eukprot:TRINITY_DN1076_c0_g1_i7.p1 TRINITY_DN1076_c0_g1~~TRINITY_DN1076_c0_g1_i7.p1  ORF type:complete len:559 (+),score=92.66 TRINITY_DN1076_c0_g1_i7:56-1678(+)
MKEVHQEFIERVAADDRRMEQELRILRDQNQVTQQLLSQAMDQVRVLMQVVQQRQQQPEQAPIQQVHQVTAHQAAPPIPTGHNALFKNDAALMELFKDGLQSETRSEICQYPPAQSLQELFNCSMQVDNHLITEQERNARLSGHWANNLSTAPPFPQAHQAQYNSQAPSHHQATHQRDDPDAMNIGAAQRGPRQQRIYHRIPQENPCFYSSPEHCRRDCPDAPPLPTRRLNHIGAATLGEQDDGKATKPVVQGHIRRDDQEFKTEILIDSDAEGCFINEEFAKELNLIAQPLQDEMTVKLADQSQSTICSYAINATLVLQTAHHHASSHSVSKPSSAHRSIHHACLRKTKSVRPATRQAHHSESIRLFVVPNLLAPVVVGIPWLAKHQPNISWNPFSIAFDSPFCATNCQHDANEPTPTNYATSASTKTSPFVTSYGKHPRSPIAEAPKGGDDDLHPRINTESIQANHSSSIHGHAPLPLAPVIIDSRIFGRKLQHLVKWEGYHQLEATWEPAFKVKLKDSIAECHADNPSRLSIGSLSR